MTNTNRRVTKPTTWVVGPLGSFSVSRIAGEYVVTDPATEAVVGRFVKRADALAFAAEKAGA